MSPVRKAAFRSVWVGIGGGIGVYAAVGIVSVAITGAVFMFLVSFPVSWGMAHFLSEPTRAEPTRAEPNPPLEHPGIPRYLIAFALIAAGAIYLHRWFFLATVSLAMVVILVSVTRAKGHEQH